MIIPVFVYGTLRVGESNYEWVKTCVQEYEKDASTPGHLWFSYSTLSFPVARFIPDSHKRIVGDVLWCDDSDLNYGQMVDMEVGAGYEQREIVVTLANGSQMDATGFHYVRDPRPSLLIKSGDWRKEHGRAKAAQQRLNA